MASAPYFRDCGLVARLCVASATWIHSGASAAKSSGRCWLRCGRKRHDRPGFIALLIRIVPLRLIDRNLVRRRFRALFLAAGTRFGHGWYRIWSRSLSLENLDIIFWAVLAALAFAG